jgi:hypothetical protein
MMTGLRKSEEVKAKANPMAATWTKAGKVRRAFKAGRQRVKDRVLTPTAAIYEACILLDELRNAMVEAKLSKDDVQAALVLMTPETPGRENTIYVLPIPQPKKLPELFAAVGKVEKPGKILPLGIAVRQLDHEAKNPRDPKSGAVVWVQPFLTGPRAEKALIKAREIFAEGTGGKSTFNYMA